MSWKRASASLLLLTLTISLLILVSPNAQQQIVSINETNAHKTSQQISPSLVIRSNSDFADLGVTGAGTRADPYIIRNLVISVENRTCIDVRDTTAYFIIFNCILKTGDQDPAIEFTNVANGQILRCEVRGGSNGIEIYNSIDCSVANTTIYGSWNAVHLDLTTNCTVSFSRLSSSLRGILLEGADFCRIVNNSIYANKISGVDLAAFSDNNTVIENSIGWNGISLGPEANAFDYGEDNHFDDNESIGNTWSDYNGTAPYGILGTSGAVDSFPGLLVDTQAPLLNGLDDTAIDVETPGNTLTWQVSDEFPNNYSVQIDHGLETFSPWNGDDITVNLDNLPVGTHTYVLTVYDGAGNTASDQVVVNVVSFILGGIGTELVMIASGITVVSFVVIILVVRKLS
ncbi:MAG: right-handed parallel beta-helix repeat-containing protein [Promethearchaeota archaeon]